MNTLNVCMQAFAALATFATIPTVLLQNFLVVLKHILSDTDFSYFVSSILDKVLESYIHLRGYIYSTKRSF